MTVTPNIKIKLLKPFLALCLMVGALICAPAVYADDSDTMQDQLAALYSATGYNSSNSSYASFVSTWNNRPNVCTVLFYSTDPIVILNTNYGYSHSNGNINVYSSVGYAIYDLGGVETNPSRDFTFGFADFPQTCYTNVPLLNFTVNHPDTIDFVFQGVSNSSVTGNSDLDLLNGLYNITFVPKSCSISNSSTDMMIDNIYECTLVSVRSDNGYNMLSIQCPALAQNQDIVYYGDFTFHLRKADTSISDGSLSFAVDVPIEQSDEPNFYIPASSYFKVKFMNPPPDGTMINNSVSFTVNEFSFLNSSGSVARYSSRSMLAFDYTGNDLYSLITFTGAVGSNMYSAGSFVYNFGYSDLVTNGDSLPPEDIEKIKEEGRKHSDDTKRNTAYVPKYNGFPDTSTKFTTPNLTNFDFTSLADLFNSLFNDYVINMMMISVSVGIVGYILFGRGD